MARNPYGSQLYIQSALLSQKVSELEPFFKEIACMNAEEKEIFSILFTVNEKGILNKPIDKMSFEELIKEIAIPIIQRMGQAKWKADVLTNLGMKVGKEDIASRFRDMI